jgi:hypothetical protein
MDSCRRCGRGVTRLDENGACPGCAAGTGDDLPSLCLLVGAVMSALLLVCPWADPSCRPVLAAIVAVNMAVGALAAGLPVHR